MGRSPCRDEVGLKKGPWTPEEDKKLIDYILTHGHHNWRNLPKSAGLNRCGKSCRLRWTNYLRPDIKRGKFSDEEERQIIHLHSVLGNKWSSMATHLPGRTDNEIKNYWNTHIKKKLLLMGIDPVTHRQRTDLELLANLQALLGVTANLGIPSWDNVLRLQTDAANIARFQIIQSLVQIIGTPCLSQSIHPMNQLGSALQNYQLTDFVLANGSLSMPQNAIPTSIPLPTNSSQPLTINFQTLCESSLPTMDQMHYSYLVPAASSSTPSLVSASSENLTADDMQDSPIKLNHIFPRLSVSTPFDSCKGQELGDLDIDLGWKDILDQLSWSSA